MPRDDRILPITRIVAAVIVPFLVLAFAVLFPDPNDTKVFAWQIKPSMSAMVLGAVYLGGAYFFVRVVRSSQWHTVAGGFIPVGTFASLMGIATILHWDKFNHTNVAFWLWVALYFTTPFLVFAVFLRNQREWQPARGSELMMSPFATSVIVAGGAAAIVMSGFLYLFPLTAVRVWPWPLTPLTARMLGAIFALGLAGLGALRDRRWSSARLLLQVEGFMLVLILIAGIRAHSDFDSSNVLTWVFAIGFAATAVATVALYIRMEAARRN
jgi:MFS family permease